MGDVGDYWNEHRAFKRAARQLWVECCSPGCQFGGNPVKVAPGRPCFHCGVIASGERGSDVRHARKDAANRARNEEQREAECRRKQSLRTCRRCGKLLKSEQGRAQHERDAHSPPPEPGNEVNDAWALGIQVPGVTE